MSVLLMKRLGCWVEDDVDDVAGGVVVYGCGRAKDFWATSSESRVLFGMRLGS